MNLSIGTTSIRQTDGLYNLNDLHKASGRQKKHQPAQFLRLANTKDLAAEIVKSTDLHTLETKYGNSHTLAENAAQPFKKINGRNGGTYFAKELVYAYAMWISPKFFLHVIQTFDALQSQPETKAVPVLPTEEKPRIRFPEITRDIEQSILSKVACTIGAKRTATITAYVTPNQAPIVKLMEGELCLFKAQDVIEYTACASQFVGLNLDHMQAQMKFIASNTANEKLKH